MGIIERVGFKKYLILLNGHNCDCAFWASFDQQNIVTLNKPNNPPKNMMFVGVPNAEHWGENQPES